VKAHTILLQKAGKILSTEISKHQSNIGLKDSKSLTEKIKKIPRSKCRVFKTRACGSSFRRSFKKSKSIIWAVKYEGGQEQQNHQQSPQESL
jgi:hypothetical protein